MILKTRSVEKLLQMLIFKSDSVCLEEIFLNRSFNLSRLCPVTNKNYFDSTVKRAEDRRQKFHFSRLPFAVCRKRHA